MEPITVLLVDDHPVVRDGLRFMLQTEASIKVVAEASNGKEALEKVEAFRPKVALMDIRMPGMDGLEATLLVKQQFPDTCVVIMTMHDDEGYVVEAVRAGAAGYLLKDAPREEVCRTVEAAASGDITIKASLLQRALNSVQGTQQGKPRRQQGPSSEGDCLTGRERSVLKELVAGKTNKEIGTALFISEETAKKHVQSIVAKLGASDRTSAAVMAVRQGLVD